MTEFLSEAWFAALERRSGELPETVGADADLEVTIGGRSGVRVRLGVTAGRVTSVELDPAGEAPLQLACTRPVARDLAAGDLDVAVAFMRGQLKVNGDMAAMHRLLPLTATDDFAALLGDLAAETTW